MKLIHGTTLDTHSIELKCATQLCTGVVCYTRYETDKVSLVHSVNQLYITQGLAMGHLCKIHENKRAWIFIGGAGAFILVAAILVFMYK